MKSVLVFLAAATARAVVAARAAVTITHGGHEIPSHSIIPNPLVFGNPSAAEHGSRGSEDVDLTNVYRNVHFFSAKPGASPVRNVKCEWGPQHPDWCLYNGYAKSEGSCVNDGNFGWSFKVPVSTVAMRTAHYEGMRSATVWIYDANGAVLDHQQLGQRGTGTPSAFVSFTASQPVIAKVLLDVHDDDGQFFCLHRIWWDAPQAQKCSHISCRHEQHTCHYNQKDNTGVQQMCGTHRCFYAIQRHHRDDPYKGSGPGVCQKKTTNCQANDECDGVAKHTSLRVTHMGRPSDVETVCVGHHRCAMGAHSGDWQKCECVTY